SGDYSEEEPRQANHIRVRPPARRCSGDVESRGRIIPVSGSERASRREQARLLRLSRRVHRTTGILLFSFFLFLAVTGLLLGWKKHSGGYLLPESQRGVSSNIADWLPISTLHANALAFARDSISAD